MIGYATIGCCDLQKSGEFYDALLQDIGAKRLHEMETMIFYGMSMEQGASLAICTPYDGEAPHRGNGNMIAIPGGSREKVDALYHKARALGASDEGEPGERMPLFYGAYVRDHDGNKLCFYDFS